MSEDDAPGYAPPAGPVPPGTVFRCNECELAKPAEEFGEDARRPGIRRRSCNDCAVRRRERAARKRARSLVTSGGTAPLPRGRRHVGGHRPVTARSDYEKLHAEQRGVCVCGNPETERGRDGAPLELEVYLVHDGPELVGRMLACRRCIRLLQAAVDDPAILARWTDRLLSLRRRERRVITTAE